MAEGVAADRATLSTVGEVSTLARVSVRTLHHYDEIGLLSPSHRSDSGYRLYDIEDLARLQQILFYRELGFPLAEIRQLMLDPAFDRRSALVAQRDLLARNAERAAALLHAVEEALDAIEEGTAMDKEEMFEVFGDFDPTQYEDEVKERWGETEAYRESARRTARYTKEDWKRFKAESEEITTALIAAFDRGLPSTDPEVLDIVERHRQQIGTWFYECPPEMHANLGRMYVADPRFTKTYEDMRPGLAQYVCDANVANAERQSRQAITTTRLRPARKRPRRSAGSRVCRGVASRAGGRAR